MNSNYADNFDVKKKNGAESIFEIQYMEGPNNLHSLLADRFAPWDSPDGLITGFEIDHDAGNGWNIPTDDFMSSYENGDLRRAASVGEDYKSVVTGETVPYVKKNTIVPMRYEGFQEIISLFIDIRMFYLCLQSA
ncbi:hypothetical protein [Pedobacter sp. NJ-S-72]